MMFCYLKIHESMGFLEREISVSFYFKKETITEFITLFSSLCIISNRLVMVPVG